MPLPRLPAGTRPDPYAKLNPAGPAEVRVGFEEKLSGPSGTYSTISVRIEVAVRCEQSEAGIAAARELLVKEGVKALEFYMGPALNLLIEHTNKQG
jgi:hypothetical protein